ncbi:hypothetical protein [Streptomyces barringtoniae]|uniref:hypothetical protein n=1 Tax=Streptomyces barringtoniae TaxID=2892029 RepID=UPI001E62F537|nr:hypothetical protein [Streptomyces barringtoniae]MCC5476473.1 hypothetical protein [Streptomyces barringtoniae]
MPASEDNRSLTKLQAHAPHLGHSPGQTDATLASGPLAHPAPAMTAGTPASPSTAPVPRPSHGLQTLGEYKGSGFIERRYIVRRGDGQVIQLSRLLYLVVSSVDGVRDAEAISHRVSGRYGAEVTTENIIYLVEHKLTPLGITVPFGDHPGEVFVPRSDLLLALRGHKVIFHEGQVARIAAALAWLHRPLVVVLTLAGVVVMDAWLFAVHGAMTPVLQVLEQPLWMLIIFALTVASLLFHEFGHASACRYSGAVPGRIGCGIFLIWPSMYTDVTDVYRIGKTGRLRTGLGGVYFNVIFMLALTAAFLLTGQSFLLAAVYLAHFEVLEQLVPAVRLDGYYILGDLAGVPDLYGKVKPILLSLLPGHHRAAAQVADLKRSARTIVTVWVLTMVPLLLAEAAYALWNLPRLLATAARGLHDQCLGTIAAFADGHMAAGLVGVIGTLMLLCPMAGGAYLAARLAARLWRAAARASAGRPVVRLAFAAAAAVGCTVLATAWVQGLTPQPLPEAAPVTPVLQPGKPAPRTPSPTPAHPTATHPATRHSVGATPGQSRPAQVPHPTASGRHIPAATPSAASPAAPPPGTGSPGPTTSAGTTPTSPAPSVSTSQTPTESPSHSSSPSQPPPTSPSPSPSTTAPSLPSHS